MASTVKPWLWELLDWDCGLDEGRVAFIAKHNIVASSIKVMSETGTFHQIKTISTGCQVEVREEAEAIVLNVSARREVNDHFEYNTHFADGHCEWLIAPHFIDDDGTVNATWLSFVNKEDLSKAFGDYTLKQLKVPSPTLPLSDVSLRVCAHHRSGNRRATNLDSSRGS